MTVVAKVVWEGVQEFAHDIIIIPPGLLEMKTATEFRISDCWGWAGELGKVYEFWIELCPKLELGYKVRIVDALPENIDNPINCGAFVFRRQLAELFSRDATC